MKFDDFLAETFQMRFSAMEILGLYSVLSLHEDTLDDSQLRVLESVRKELYPKFSIEEFEVLENLYQKRCKGC